jgi:hypothetical protein
MLVLFVAMLFHKVFEMTIQEVSKAIHNTENSIKQEQKEIKDLLLRISQKPIMPVLMNLSGQAVNLAREKGMQVEARYNPVQETLECSLFIDHRKFDSWSMGLTKFSEEEKERERKAIFDLGRALLRNRKEGFLDKIQEMILTELVVASQYRERLNHYDIFSIIVFGYLDAAKPYYQEDIEKRKEIARPVPDPEVKKESTLSLVNLGDTVPVGDQPTALDSGKE